MRSLRRRNRDNPGESDRLRRRIQELEEQAAHLEGSEERFRILFEDAPDGYYLSDVKGTFVDGNAAAETITGYKRRELVGKNFLALHLLSSADSMKAARLLTRNLLGSSTGPDEFALTRKDGTVVPVEIRTHPVTIGGRRLVLGIARDISQRMQTEHQLNERVKELQAFYNLSEIAEKRGASLDAIYQDLADALPRSWQHADVACARITVGEREFRSSRYADPPWRQSAPIRVDGAAIGAIEVGYLEERPEEHEGPFLEEERHVLDALASRLGGIAQRVKKEEALRRSEERYSALFHQIHDGVALADAKTGLILDGNVALCRMVERDLPELVGQPQSILHPPRQVGGGLTPSFRDYQAGQPIEEVLVSKSGARVPVEITAAHVNIEGRPCLLGIFRDITTRKRAEEALERSLSLLSQSQEIAHVGSWELDLIADRLVWSDEVYRIFGLEPGAVPATYGAFLDVVHPEDRAAVDAAYRQSVREGRDHYSIEHRLIRPRTGEIRYVHEKCIHERTPDGAVLRSIGIVQDITERRQAETYRALNAEILEILNESESLKASIARILGSMKARTGADAVGMRLQDGDDFPYFAEDGLPSEFLLTENSLVERSADGGICRDKDGNVCLECTCGLVIRGKTDPSNPLFTKGGSWWTNDSRPLLDLPLAEDPRHRPRNTCIHTGYASVALVPIRAKGKTVGLFQLNARRKGFLSLATVEQLEGIAAHVGDALVRRQYEDELARMARHDPLTGAFNRYALDELLEREASRSRRYGHAIGLLMIDINRFKEINDHFGHVMGDKVLQAVANVIRGSTRDSDFLIRYGGDEFLVVLPEADGRIDAVQDRIQAQVARRNASNALLDFPVALAIGVYRWLPGEGGTIDQAIAEADRRMYADKRKLPPSLE